MKRLVKITEGEYECKDEWWGGIYECPSCKEEKIWGKFNYCPNCGYKIEWTKVDTETAVNEQNLACLVWWAIFLEVIS